MKTIEELIAENEALKSKLKEKDEKIQSLEKVNNWYYLGDNIHPSDKGMQVIAEAVIEKINELLK